MNRVFKNLLIIILALGTGAFHLEAQAQTDVVLKNGRNVVYHKQGSQYVRPLEPEENEFIQYSIARLLNSFNKVKISGYEQAQRLAPDIEDIYRNREDDKNGWPQPLRLGLTYTAPGSQEGSVINVAIDANSRGLDIPTGSNARETEVNGWENIWKIEQATLKFGSRSYTGPVYIIALGQFSQPTFTAGKWTLKGTFPQKGHLQTSNIFITIAAPEEQALDIIRSIQQQKLTDALQYRENWP